jgi:uncharacterized membrane protein YebE (DUF533 family)
MENLLHETLQEALTESQLINEGKIAKFCAKHPKLCKGGKIVGGALALGGVAYGAKKGYDKYNSSKSKNPVMKPYKDEKTFVSKSADYGF